MPQGQRNDLRHEDGIDDVDEIQYSALLLAKAHYGVTAGLLNGAVNCSKEWCRKILNRMNESGLLELQDYGCQFHLFRLTDLGKTRLEKYIEDHKIRS